MRTRGLLSALSALLSLAVPAAAFAQSSTAEADPATEALAMQAPADPVHADDPVVEETEVSESTQARVESDMTTEAERELMQRMIRRRSNVDGSLRVAAGVSALALAVGGGISGGIGLANTNSREAGGVIVGAFGLAMVPVGLALALTQLLVPTPSQHRLRRFDELDALSRASFERFAGELLAVSEIAKQERMYVAGSSFGLAGFGALLGGIFAAAPSPLRDGERLSLAIAGATLSVVGLVVGLIAVFVPSDPEKDWDEFQAGRAALRAPVSSPTARMSFDVLPGGGQISVVGTF